MSGTETAYAAIRLREYYAMSGAEVAYATMLSAVLRSRMLLRAEQYRLILCSYAHCTPTLSAVLRYPMLLHAIQHTELAYAPTGPSSSPRLYWPAPWPGTLSSYGCLPLSLRIPAYLPMDV
eukprot:1947642-Rhodomonas_salina.1